MSRWKVGLLIVAVAVGYNALLAIRDAHGSSSRAGLVGLMDKQVRDVERAKTTLRFFERHPRILYSRNPRVRARAWHAVAVARQRVIVGRSAIQRTRARIAAVTSWSPPDQPQVVHRAAWMCIHGKEAPWDYDKDAPGHNGLYDGGLQMDRGFQETYGPELLRRKGSADRWTAEEQMIVAERAYYGFRGERARGFSPWPNTARACGLL